MSALATPSRLLRGSDRLYSTPPGYYDLPMTWIYDASALTDGNTYRNQQVAIHAGYGDFVLRRVVGLNNVLSNSAPPTNGQFQLRDAIGRFLESLPQNVGRGTFGQIQFTSGDIAIVRELLFKENQEIYFDLYNIARATDFGGVSFFGAQIGFQGVRRLKGRSPFDPTYDFRPKTYAYVTQAVLVNSTATLSNPQHIITPVDNYDFELREIRLSYQLLASAFLTGDQGQLSFFAKAAGPLGNGITINVVLPVGPTPLGITVVGNLITITGALSMQDVINLIQGNLSASALIGVSSDNPTGFPEYGSVTTAGGGAPVTNSNNALSLCQLFDENTVACSYQPVRDQYIDATSNYHNGAVVPPLLYRQNSQIRMDVVSLLGGSAMTMTIQYIGRQRIPC
jgi:hypothetical protein